MVVEASSFRDPAGRVIIEDGQYIREISEEYLPEFRHFIESGLYDELVEHGYLIEHKDYGFNRVLPEQLGFISYPQEWCFSQLKDAALLTLDIQRLAMKHDMMLKDASAYNIQRHQGRPVLIDTLSFIRYQEGMPWGAHRQFVQEFLAPLLLRAYRRLPYPTINGTPLGKLWKLLPLRLLRRPSAWVNFYNEAWGDGLTSKRDSLPRFSRIQLALIFESLYGLVKGLKYKPQSAWSKYEQESYSQKALISKNDAMRRILSDVAPGVLWDIGTNTGRYATFAANKGHQVIATDRDHDCIEQLYLKNKSDNLMPLVVDLCQPTPAIGWSNTERASFLTRVNPDTIMALALIHHLCIGNNVPLANVAELLASKCNTLIIEWVPPDDPMAMELARFKSFPTYDRDLFECVFSQHFSYVTLDIEGSQRVIYYMRK